MSILTQQLPTHVGLNRIDWDFRCMIRFEELIFDEERPHEERLQEALTLFYPHGFVGSVMDAWEGLLWFYRCGLPSPPQASGSGAAVRAYDFAVDAGRIVAAFQQAYGLDLTDGTPLHWWRFRALFENLPADCRLCRVMDYRTADTSGMSDKAKAYYRRMKQLYAIEQRRKEPLTVEKHDEAFITRLKGGR